MSPQFWLNLENAYQLSKLPDGGGAIKQRAKLFETAPIRDMEKRGWIRVYDSVEDTEKELGEFFYQFLRELRKLPELRLAARASAQNGS